MLVKVEHPQSLLYQLTKESSGSQLFIYDGDSVCYVSNIRFLKDAVTISPEGKFSYSNIYRGNGNMLYFEGNSRRPLHFLNDTTAIIQRFGVKYTMVRATGLVHERANEILSIARSSNYTDEGHKDSFFISKVEKDLRQTNHTLLYIISLLVLASACIVFYAIRACKRNKHLKQQLRQIEEERELRPEKVNKAMLEVESDFMQSDYYAGIRQHIAQGERLTIDDWREMETQLKRVYPNFINRLRELVSMSEVEYHVCLLVKLQVAPKEIAMVLCKERSTISSIRSRLYQKVFHKKGSSADWDDFVKSL